MKVYYVLYPSEKPWGSDFAASNIKKMSSFDVQPISVKDVSRCEDALVYFHNIQVAAHTDIRALKRRNIAVVAGIRGRMGLNQREKIRSFDAIAVNADPGLSAFIKTLHPHVYVVPEGIETDLFAPTGEAPSAFTVGWVGSDHKEFKGAQLLDGFQLPVKKATYNNYVPHDEMPAFYNSVNALAVLSEHEGFCLPLVEAAACGLPVVSHDVGVAREVLSDDWIVEESPSEDFSGYKERMDMLRGDPELCRRVGSENRKRAIAFDWRHVIGKFDDMWRQTSELALAAPKVEEPKKPLGWLRIPFL